MSRNVHALNTKFNVLYNGQIALDKGLENLRNNDQDNFWNVLPVEKMMFVEESIKEDTTKNADFALAEKKATKAIQKHSMNINGKEKNTQIDEAYLLLGKSRYYDQRFIPALDAFNYILYKYPNSDKIFTAKIWREKTNMRLGNDALVIKNIGYMLKSGKIDKQTNSDANALLAEAFMNLKQNDSAIAKLRKAEYFAQNNKDKGRYRFILGQLYNEIGIIDSARYFFDGVIAMNRKIDRKYLMHAHAKKIDLLIAAQEEDTEFLKQYLSLIEDRENRPFLDILNYHLGLYFNTINDSEASLKAFNASLKRKSADKYLVASTYKNIANYHFNNNDYSIAAKYYDSTLVNLDPKTREFIALTKKKQNLDKVITYEVLATKNDSIINVYQYSPAEREKYFEDFIVELKKKDEARKKAESFENEKLKNQQFNAKSNGNPADDVSQNSSASKNTASSTIKSDSGVQFYFYNPTTVAYGKLQFEKLWGKRQSNGYWRAANQGFNVKDVDSLSGNIIVDKLVNDTITNPKYTTAYYLSKLPTTDAAVDSIKKERNLAYYQLGILYKDNLQEVHLAVDKLEQLLTFNPEDKLILPTHYNLYKLYENLDPIKAASIAKLITTTYPDSRYTQIISNKGKSVQVDADKEYQKWYALYDKGEYKAVLDTIDQVIINYSADVISAKFELLKAFVLAKLNGLVAYKQALEFVSEQYPNTLEAEKANQILTFDIPQLEKRNFIDEPSTNWNIIFKVSIQDKEGVLKVQNAVEQFLRLENFQNLLVTEENYNLEEKIIRIHGITTEVYAQDLSTLFKSDKNYKVPYESIVISSENYNLVQIRKNLNEYLNQVKTSDVSTKQLNLEN